MRRPASAQGPALFFTSPHAAMDPKNWTMDQPGSRLSAAAAEPGNPRTSSQGSFSFGDTHPGSSTSAPRALPHRVHSANARSEAQSASNKSAGGSREGGSSSRQMQATVSSSALGSAIAAAWRDGLLGGDEDQGPHPDPVLHGAEGDASTADRGEEPDQPSVTWQASYGSRGSGGSGGSRGSQGGQGLQLGYSAEEDFDDGYVQEDTGGDNEEAEEAQAEATLGRGLAAGGEGSGLSAASAHSRGSGSGLKYGGLSGGPSSAARSGRGSPSPHEGEGEKEHESASGSRSGSGSGRGSGSTSEVEPGEDEWQARKHRLAAQGMLPAAELAPEEWARIGPPQVRWQGLWSYVSAGPKRRY